MPLHDRVIMKLGKWGIRLVKEQRYSQHLTKPNGDIDCRAGLYLANLKVPDDEVIILADLLKWDFQAQP